MSLSRTSVDVAKNALKVLKVKVNNSSLNGVSKEVVNECIMDVVTNLDLQLRIKKKGEEIKKRGQQAPTTAADYFKYRGGY